MTTMCIQAQNINYSWASRTSSFVRTVISLFPQKSKTYFSVDNFLLIIITVATGNQHELVLEEIHLAKQLF